MEMVEESLYRCTSSGDGVEDHFSRKKEQTKYKISKD